MINVLWVFVKAQYILRARSVSSNSALKTGGGGGGREEGTSRSRSAPELSGSLGYDVATVTFCS